MKPETKKCSRCGVKKPMNQFYTAKRHKHGVGSWCKECHIEYGKERYARSPEELRRKARDYRFHRKTLYEAYYREYRQKYPERINARNRVYDAVKNRQLKRPNHCSSCGGKCLAEGHHPDYAKVLEVIWLCNSCHRKLHNNLDG